MSRVLEIPEELRNALATRDVVFFVGAGASIDPPSSLPSFKQLAQNISRLADYPMEDMTLDRFFGELGESFDVKTHVSRVLAPKDSMPNEIHKLVVKLACSQKRIRIITTNFDNHLVSAADELEIDLGGQYYGPELPTLESFEGIAHIHSCVTRQAKHLVITDKDFAQAYLTDGWAARFLYEVFTKTVVVFVGFSYNDPLAQYLTLGLPAGGSRFVFTDEPASKQWNTFGVTPIPYRVTEVELSDGEMREDHSDLRVLLKSWFDYASLTPIDKYEAVSTLTTGVPPKSDQISQYLKLILDKDFAWSAFTKHAKGHEWLSWVEEHYDLSLVFDARKHGNGLLPLPTALENIVRWMASVFVSSHSTHIRVLRLFEKYGNNPHPDFVFFAGRAVDVLAKQDPGAAGSWRALLSSHPDGLDSDRLLLLDTVKDLSSSRPLCRGALTEAFASRLRLQRPLSVFSDESDRLSSALPDARPSWDIRDYYLEEVWAQYKSRFPKLELADLSILEARLLTALISFEAWNGPDRDDANLVSPAFSVADGGEHLEGIEHLILAIRDCAVDLPAYQLEIINRWSEYGYTIFLRLAAYVVEITGALSDDDKISWLLKRELIDNFRTHEEAYRLVTTSVNRLSSATKAELLTAVVGDLAGPYGDIEDEQETWSRLRILERLRWLAEGDPSWVEASEALTEFINNYPQFEGVRTDFTPNRNRFEIATREESNSKTEEILTVLVSLSADDAIHWISKQEYDTSPFSDSLTRQDVFYAMRQCAREHFQISVRIWDSLAENASLTEDHELLTALVSGWEQVADTDHCDQILTCIESMAFEPKLAEGISKYLSTMCDAQSKSISREQKAWLLEISEKVWNQNARTFVPSGSSSLDYLSMNSWPGRISQVWLTTIEALDSEQPKRDAGLTRMEQARLIKMLESKTPAGEVAAFNAASHLFNLAFIDPDFTKEHLLPRFHDPDLISTTWIPYLYHRLRVEHPHVGSPLFDIGFLQILISAVPNVIQFTQDNAELGEERKNDSKAFYILLIDCLNNSKLSENDRANIIDAILNRDSTYMIEEFVNVLSTSLSRLGSDFQRHIWVTWLSEFIKKRVDGIPMNASDQELVDLSDILAHFPSCLGDGLEIFGPKLAPYDQSSIRYISDEYLDEFDKELLASYFVGRLTKSSLDKSKPTYDLIEVAKYLALEPTISDQTKEDVINVSMSAGLLLAPPEDN